MRNTDHKIHKMPHMLAAILSLMVAPVLACGGSDSSIPTLIPTASVDRETGIADTPEQVASAESGEAVPDAPTARDVPPTAAVVAATDVPPPTDVAPATDAEDLLAQMVEELSYYDYDSLRVVVEDVEIRGAELIIYLRRVGSPSLTDYFGQLGAIHGIVALNEPDVTTVRTFDVEGRNGFVVEMEDLMDFYHDRLDAETYRGRWDFFEP